MRKTITIYFEFWMIVSNLSFIFTHLKYHNLRILKYTLLKLWVHHIPKHGNKNIVTILWNLVSTFGVLFEFIHFCVSNYTLIKFWTKNCKNRSVCTEYLPTMGNQTKTFVSSRIWQITVLYVNATLLQIYIYI